MTTEQDAQSVIEILDELAEIFTNARSVPMSASAMVNRSQVLDLLATARDILPEQIVEADGLLANASDVTSRAQDEALTIRERAEQDAHDIVSAAQEQASRLVSQDSVTVAARAQASRIVDEANTQAEKLRQGADAYSDARLSGLQDRIADLGNSLDTLTREIQDEIDVLLSQIQAGRNVIAGRHEEEGIEEGAMYVSEETGEQWT